MAIGVDYGGTKIEAVWLDPDGAERARTRVATPRDDYEGSVRAVADLVRRVEAETGHPGSPVGIGIPGSIDPASGLVRNGNSTWLIGRAFDRDVGAALGRPVRMENDGKCLVLSEALDGAGRGARSVFGIILGTGVGGALVVDGRIHRGANGICGEWGHVPLIARTPEELDGPMCFCGQQGCVETWLSGPGISADYARALGIAPADAPKVQEIAALAAAGDAGAQGALDRHLARLARMLGLIVNIVDPEVIVMGGGVTNMPHFTTDLVPAIAPHVYVNDPRIDLRRAEHGDSSGVRGAARLWEQKHD